MNERAMKTAEAMEQSASKKRNRRRSERIMMSKTRKDFTDGIRDGYGEALPLNDAREYALRLTPVEWDDLIGGGYDNGFALGTEIAEWEGKEGSCPSSIIARRALSAKR